MAVTQKNENPFTNRTIIQHLSLAGPTTQHLNLLRQISTTFNSFMSLIYFDKLDKTIYVNEVGSPGMVLRIRINKSPDKDKYEVIKFNRENWTPALGPIFRRLEIDKYQLTRRIDDLCAKEIAPHLGPHITHLVFNPNDETRWKRFETPVKPNTVSDVYVDVQKFFISLGNFIGQFHNLKKIQFHLWTEYPELQDIMPIIQKIRRSTQILFVLDGHSNQTVKNFLFNLNTFSNVEFEINSNCRNSDLMNISHFITENIQLSTKILFVLSHDIVRQCFELKTFKRFPNFKFRINYALVFNYQKLVSVVDFFLENLDVILEPSLMLHIHETETDNENWKGLAREKLLQLSPHLHTLKCEGLHLPHGPKYERLLTSINFPNLKVLHLYKFKKPEAILQNCQRLEYLHLHLDHNACISKNPQLTPKENLKEFINSINMENLKKFTFIFSIGVSAQGVPIKPDNDLIHYFKSLVPKSVDFEVGFSPNIFD